MSFTTYNEITTGIALKFHVNNAVENNIEITADNDKLNIHYKFVYGDGRRVYDKIGDSYGNGGWWSKEPGFKYSKYSQEDYANWDVLTQAVINGGTPNNNVSVEFDPDYDLKININGGKGNIVLFISKETAIPNVEYDYDNCIYKYTNKSTNINIDKEIGKKEIVDELNNIYEHTTALRIENYVLKHRVNTLTDKIDKLIKSFE